MFFIRKDIFFSRCEVEFKYISLIFTIKLPGGANLAGSQTAAVEGRDPGVCVKYVDKKRPALQRALGVIQLGLEPGRA